MPNQSKPSQTNTCPAQSCFYTANDGVQLHYLLWPSQNPNSNSCCLLLHGFTNDAHIWDGLSAKLQKQHNVIAIDFRGHGDSDWDSEEKYTHLQLLEDIHQLIESQPFKSWHIIGHSLGARIAMLMLARKPVKPASFTIIDTGPEVRAVGVDKVRKDAQNTPKTFASTESFTNYLTGIYLFGQAERIRAMAQYGLKKVNNQLIAKTDPAFTTALWKTDPLQHDANDLRYPLNEELWLALAHIQCPSLILKGQASAILAKNIAEKMATQVMPNARLEIIPRAGHAMMVDNPEKFERAVCQFVEVSGIKSQV